MTREEAVIILDGFKNNPLFSNTHVQALDMAISALKENEEESEDQSVEWYCTDCPYFQFTGEPSADWYGARCNKDGHETSPSMYAIQSLNDNCPLNRG